MARFSCAPSLYSVSNHLLTSIPSAPKTLNMFPFRKRGDIVPRVRSRVLWSLSPGMSPAEAPVPRLQGRCQEWRPQAALPLADDQEGVAAVIITSHYMIFLNGSEKCNVMLKRAQTMIVSYSI